MSENSEATEMAQAAREMRQAAAELRALGEAWEPSLRTWKDYERAIQELRRQGVELEKVDHAVIGFPVIGNLSEEEAARIADEAVKESRRERSSEEQVEAEREAPTPEEVRARRDERRRREGYPGYEAS